MTIKQPGGQFILAIGKDRRRNDNFITCNPNNLMTACIDLRADVFDDNAPATIGRFQWHAGPVFSREHRCHRSAEGTLKLDANRTPGVRQLEQQ